MIIKKSVEQEMMETLLKKGYTPKKDEDPEYWDEESMTKSNNFCDDPDLLPSEEDTKE